MKNNIKELEKIKYVIGPFKEVTEASAEGQMIVLDHTEKKGLIVSAFHFIPCIYENIGPCYDGTLFACKDGEWYLIDEQQHILRSYGKYEGAVPMLSVLVVSKDGYKGILGKDGKLAVPCEYRNISQEIRRYHRKEKEPILILEDNQGMIRLADAYGKIVTTHLYNIIGTSGYPFYRDYTDSFCRLIELSNIEDNAMVIFNCETAREVTQYVKGQKTSSLVVLTHRNYFNTYKDGLCQLLDMEGNVLIPYEAGYSQLECFSYDSDEYLIPACKNGKWGYCNIYGVEKIPCKYDYAQHFVNGAAAVFCKTDEIIKGIYTIRKGWVIDRHGKPLHNFIYDCILSHAMINGKLYVEGSRLGRDEYGIIGPDGEMYDSYLDVDKSLEYVEYSSNSCYDCYSRTSKLIVYRNNKSDIGWIDQHQPNKHLERKGFELFNSNKDGDTLYIRKINGHIALYDSKAKMLVPAVFDKFEACGLLEDVFIGRINGIGDYVIFIS